MSTVQTARVEVEIDINGMKSVVDNTIKDIGELRMICGKIIHNSTENSNQNRRKKLELINSDANYMEHCMEKVYQQLMAVYVSLGFMGKEDQQ